MRVDYICESCGKAGHRSYAQGKVPSHFFCSVACQNKWQKTRQDIVAKNKDPEFRKKVSEGLKQRKIKLGDHYHSDEAKRKIGNATIEHWANYDDETRNHMLKVLQGNATALRTYGPYDFAWKQLSNAMCSSGICHRCGSKENLHVHHIIPVKEGGTRELATVIRTSSGTRKIPIAEDSGEASWIDEGEEIPEADATFGQTTLAAYKMGTMIKISNELLHDSAFDLASYIARRFGVRMGNAEEKAFITGDGQGKPLGLLAETGGVPVGVTAASETAVKFDEIFDLYYALKSPYRKKAKFLCNEALLLQLMKIKDKNDNYIWKPSLDVAKPDTILGKPIYTSSYMPAISGNATTDKNKKVLLFGDFSYYWIADRTNRTFKRLNELYAVTDQVGFIGTQRVDGKLILPEAMQVMALGTGTASSGS